mgnify:CR=1 FL=1
MKFLKINLGILTLLLLIGCSKSTSNEWTELTENVKVRTFSEYIDGEYLQIRLDIAENEKNPVYAIGEEAYNQRLSYFNSTIIEDVKLKAGQTLSPFDMHTERNFGYKDHLTILFFFDVDKADLNDIEHIQYFDNCFGVGKVKLEFVIENLLFERGVFQGFCIRISTQSSCHC